MVVESAPLNEQELGEFCRRRSVFPEQLASWREACNGANEVRQVREDSADNRKLVRRNAELESELRRMEKALAEAAALLMLQKKVALCEIPWVVVFELPVEEVDHVDEIVDVAEAPGAALG